MRFDGSTLFAASAPGPPLPPTFLLGFAPLGAMAGVWLVLVAWLLHRLRNRHALTYEAIGSPSLIWNNSLRSNWLFLRFLYSPRRLELGDEPASRVVGVLRVLFPLYFLLFIALVVWFLVSPPA